MITFDISLISLTENPYAEKFYCLAFASSNWRDEMLNKWLKKYAKFTNHAERECSVK
jgi:hypothetical protein